MQAAIKRAFGYEWIHELSLQSNSTAPKGPIYGALEMRGASLLWKGERDSLSKDILTKPGNEEDAYLWGGRTMHRTIPGLFQGRAALGLFC